MTKWTIYCHTHLDSGRRYVGQTRLSMERRWKGHVWTAKASKTGFGFGYFLNAIRKYGAHAFGHEVLEICETQETANESEIRWIAKLETCDPRKGFNLRKGGQGAPNLAPRSPWDRPEYRAHQIASTIPKLIAARNTPEANAALRAVKQTPEYRAEQSIRSKEVMARPEVRAKQKAARATPEWKARFSEIGRSIPHIVAQREQTHCKRGHEFTAENTRLNGRGGRICKTCKNARERARTAKPPKPPITHCVNGHELTPENVWLRGTSRCCRACNRERQRARNARLKTT